MSKFARPANMKRLWVWGKCYEFFLVTSNGSNGNLTEGRNLTALKVQNGVVTNQGQDFSGTIANPNTGQKNQIVLHCTAGNTSAENVINAWNSPNSPVGSAHYVVERTATQQAARPAIQPGNDLQDTGLIDAVKVMPENTITYHAGIVNECSIGIEIINVAWGLGLTNLNHEPTLVIPHIPETSCPQRVNYGNNTQPVWRCRHRHLLDRNRFIDLNPPVDGSRIYQAYEDEQYKTLIFLLRHLCIEHRIPRTFLGLDTENAMRRYNWSLAQFATQNAQRKMGASAIFHFRGILQHRNVHENKSCPGILHRNRLYRGIIDEWWMPVECTGEIRNYYSGPFKNPPYQANQPPKPSCFKWGHFTQNNQPTIEACTYSDATLDSITETRPHFDPNQLLNYYAYCETKNGGLFPVGNNKIWHGGIHFYPPAINPAIYAAASGTIVAARLSSNAETDNNPHLGSQRFVLIRHAVHTETENDPEGIGQRINYTAAPKLIFSLYMHLAPFADLQREHNTNPPWFNLWLRNHQNDANRPQIGLTNDNEKGRVFNPDIEVCVGDILGIAGNFNGQQHCVHFEIFSHRNSTISSEPWNNSQLIFDDSNDSDAICDLAAIDNYIKDQNSDGIDLVDLLRAAPNLRNAKALHKSEWSLKNDDSLKEVVPHTETRKELWKHFKRFVWWDDALAANPKLKEQIGNDGITWHYHPVTFMNYVNKLCEQESREISENEFLQTNIELDENFYLKRFISRQNNAYTEVHADNSIIYPYQVSNALLNYHTTRQDLACRICRNNNTIPTSTFITLALIDALEQIRLYTNIALTVSNSHVCDNHVTNASACSIPDQARRTEHNHGHAVDFRPSSLTNVTCKNLYNGVRHFIDTSFNPQAAQRGGNTFQDCLPKEFAGMELVVFPDSAFQKLQQHPQQVLNQSEVSSFSIHLSLSKNHAVAPPSEAASIPQDLHFRVTINSITVIDDNDWFGDGEWELSGQICGKNLSKMFKTVSCGTTIPAPSDWQHEVSFKPESNSSITISVSGIEKDLLFDDDLGTAKAVYNAISKPAAWGIGQQSIKSSKGDFLINLTIDSLNDDVTSI